MRGHASADDVIDAVHGDDVVHVFEGPESTLSVVELLALLRTLEAAGIGAAQPAEGDPVGLGGPADFNAAALEVGEAVYAVGADVGWVPVRVGPSVEWHRYAARPRQLDDVGEADRGLRASLLETATALAALDVARWRPEVADELLNLQHRRRPVVPAGTPERCVDLVARGVQAGAIVDLALDDPGGAVSAGEIELRRQALLPLGRAARRAITAGASPEVWPT